MPADTDTFSGFRPEAIQFLVGLAENNDRAWFTPRKADFERLLRRPLEALCVALDERFRARGIPLTADPARSPFRIYRDVRFSKDKSPYKTNISASFPWAGGADPDLSRAERAGGTDPGGYFHLAPGEVYVGGGMWHPPIATLAGFRRAVADDPDGVRALIDEPRFAATFGSLSGESLKRAPAGFPPDHPEIDLLKLKDVTFGHRLSDADVMSPDLPDTIADSFAVAVPVMRWLAGL